MAANAICSDIAWRISANNYRKGNVKDTTGEPIIGASVVEKGNTTNGTITDLDGNYSIKVPSKATLTISYIGMKTQDIAVKDKVKLMSLFPMIHKHWTKLW